MQKIKNLKKAGELNKSLNKVIAIAENYPELKASEQFISLQNNLVKMESQLQAARRIYNTDVQRYNSAIQTVPSNIVAGIFGFKEKEFFQIEEYTKTQVFHKNLTAGDAGSYLTSKLSSDTSSQTASFKKCTRRNTKLYRQCSCEQKRNHYY